MGKSIKIILLMFSCLLFTSCFRFLENDVLMTGKTISNNENTIVVGTCTSFSPSGIISVFEKRMNNWSEIFRYKVPYIFHGPITFAMNDKFIVAGLDTMRGFPGFVVVLVNNKGKWKKGYYIKAPKFNKDDYFGFSISLNENQLLVGAKGSSGKGKAYLYILHKKKATLLHEFVSPSETNVTFGNAVLLSSSFVLITDSDYYSDYNLQYFDKHVYEKDSNGKKHLKIEYNDNKKNEGVIYLYDSKTFELKKTFINDEFQNKFCFGSWLGTNGILCNKDFIISDFSSLFYLTGGTHSLRKIWSKDEKTYFSIVGGNDNSCRNYAYSDGILIIGDSIYKFENDLKKLNTINLICNPDENNKPFGVYSFYKDLLICTDDNCDNYAKRKEQEINGHKRGYSHPFVEKPINQGRVHILRIAPDGSYTEEAIIARRTNKDGKIEFYDMLHDDK